jgi:hypothetical protein
MAIGARKSRCHPWNEGRRGMPAPSAHNHVINSVAIQSLYKLAQVGEQDHFEIELAGSTIRT